MVCHTRIHSFAEVMETGWKFVFTLPRSFEDSTIASTIARVFPCSQMNRALRAIIQYCFDIPFDPPNTGKIAVKVINCYGDEVMKVNECGEERWRAWRFTLFPLQYISYRPGCACGRAPSPRRAAPS
ncbi:MAG: hypothetical protein NTU62_11310 [Spirochaetes bacterium]|nr:hypothetical protein [Spirochaetota bacterium]